MATLYLGKEDRGKRSEPSSILISTLSAEGRGCLRRALRKSLLLRRAVLSPTYLEDSTFINGELRKRNATCGVVYKLKKKFCVANRQDI